MKIFSALYQRMMVWAKHPHAPWYLAATSFAESSFFPCPPDVMLLPMCLSHPERAWRYATITALFSLLGGIFGYLLGMFFIELLRPMIFDFGYGQAFQHVQLWFDHWGVWAVFLAGFSPIPYKLFTLGAGALHMPLLPFIIASFFGRGLRFFAEAAAMRWGGHHIERVMVSYIDKVGWLLVLSLVIVYVVMKLHH